MASRLSKLDAVNIVLAGIGESPVSSLSSGLPDAEAAERFLDETSLDIQESGWHCNREVITLNRSASIGSVNHILLPNNVLRVDSHGDDAHINVVQRGDKLYHIDENTYVFDQDLECEVVYALDFEDLSYRLAYYIAWVAAGRYQMREMGSGTLADWIKTEIDEAKAKLDKTEESIDDANVLRDSASVRLIAHRNSYNRIVR